VSEGGGEGEGEVTGLGGRPQKSTEGPAWVLAAVAGVGDSQQGTRGSRGERGRGKGKAKEKERGRRLTGEGRAAVAVAGGRRCDGGGRGEWGRCVVGERGCEKERKGCKKVREEEQAQPCAGREKPDPRTAVREGTGSRACLLGKG